VFHKPLYDGVLGIVKVDVLFEVPSTLFTVVDSTFKFILGHHGHVVYVIRPQEVLVGHASVASPLRRLHVSPARMVAGDLCDDLIDLLAIIYVGGVGVLVPSAATV
jgi:hypothetical protein